MTAFGLLTLSLDCAVRADLLDNVRVVMRSDLPIDPKGPAALMGAPSRGVINAAGHVAFMTAANDDIHVWTEIGGVLTSADIFSSGVDLIYALDDDTIIYDSRVGVATRPPPQPRVYHFAGKTVTRISDAEFASLTGVHSNGKYVFDARDRLVVGGLGEEEVVLRRAGTPAPGTEEGTVFSRNSAFSAPRINRHGQIVFASELQGPLLQDENRAGIWSTINGELELVYRTGDLLPNRDDGSYFSAMTTSLFGEPQLNDHGDITFLAGIAFPDGSRTGGVFARREGRLDLVAMPGDVISGNTEFVLGSLSLVDTAINNQGRVAFRAFDRDRNLAFVVESLDGSLSVLARRGDPVPRTDAAQLLPARMTNFQMNLQGQVAFSSRYQDGDERLLGAFASNSDGELEAIVLPGDQIRVARGDTRIVDQVTIDAHNGGNADGLPSIMTDDGQTLVGVRFTDGTSALVVSHAVSSTPIRGNFNQDGRLDALDLDVLNAAIREGLFTAEFDLSGDGLLDLDDRDHWVRRLMWTDYGDANLDGVFDSDDLVAVFQAGRYELEDVTVGWAEGDWDGDGQFASADIILAFASGWYDSDIVTEAAAIPEPTDNGQLFLLALILIWTTRQNQ